MGGKALTKLISSVLSAQTSMLIVHCIGNFLLVRSENQRQSQLEVKFYSRSYISQQDQVGYSSGGGTMNLYTTAYILWF